MKKYILISILALGVFAGCKDFLTEEPPLAQRNDLALATFDGCNKAVAGAYAPLASINWYGNEFIVLHEMKTSNGKKYIGSSFDSGRLNDWYNLNYNANNTAGLWGVAYYVISAANNVIDNLEGKGEEQDRNNLKAECLFLRALSHFDLVRTYAQPYSYTDDASHDGVPVVLHTDMEAKPARATVAKVYEQIIADLLEAENIIDPEYVRDGITDPTSTVTIHAIRALLSRVYLYSEDWQGAADYATKVIGSKAFELWTEEELEDGACYAEDVPEGGEVIFEVYGNANNSYDGHNDGIWNLTGPNGYGDAGASSDIMGLYSASDIRKSLFQSDRGASWTRKYQGKGVGKPDVTNTIVLRLAEMYLNRAEAIEKGATVEGISKYQDIKDLAASRGATEKASLEGIYEERQKELAWEGHLWFDLARTGRNMTRTDFVGTPASKDLAAKNYKWAMPIPSREHIVNPNLKPNPGY